MPSIVSPTTEISHGPTDRKPFRLHQGASVAGAAVPLRFCVDRHLMQMSVRSSYFEVRRERLREAPINCRDPDNYPPRNHHADGASLLGGLTHKQETQARVASRISFNQARARPQMSAMTGEVPVALVLPGANLRAMPSGADHRTDSREPTFLPRMPSDLHPSR